MTRVCSVEGGDIAAAVDPKQLVYLGIGRIPAEV